MHHMKSVFSVYKLEQSSLCLSTCYLYRVEKGRRNTGKKLQKSAWGPLKHFILQFSSVQSLSRARLFLTTWIAAHQASLSITNSQSSPKFMSIESVMPSSHLILCCPFSSCSYSLSASEYFPMSQLFAWGGQLRLVGVKLCKIWDE